MALLMSGLGQGNGGGGVTGLERGPKSIVDSFSERCASEKSESQGTRAQQEDRPQRREVRSFPV